MTDVRREEQLRIQALGAAISRRDWHAAEQAYNAIRDEFDRRALAKPASSPVGGDVREALREIAEQDVTEIALDPDWPRRIARAALSQSTSAGRVGE